MERQRPITFEFDGLVFRDAFRCDLVVEDRPFIEVKSVDRPAPVHGKPLLTYLRLARKPVGLLMNFGEATIREGLKRIVNEHTDFASSRLRVNQLRPRNLQ